MIEVVYLAKRELLNNYLHEYSTSTDSIHEEFLLITKNYLVSGPSDIWSVAKYILLTEFEGRTVFTDRVFSSSIYGPSAKRAGHKSKVKNEDP